MIVMHYYFLDKDVALCERRWSSLVEDRYFSPDPAQLQVARRLYQRVKGLPLVCPHGHVDPRLLAASNYDWGTPVDLLIIPDHYVFRMLYSQGISLEEMGIPRAARGVPTPDGGADEIDHRQVWQTFADHFYLFRGTPTGIWLAHELHEVFGIQEPLNGANAQAIYAEIAARLTTPAFRPRGTAGSTRCQAVGVGGEHSRGQCWHAAWARQRRW